MKILLFLQCRCRFFLTILRLLNDKTAATSLLTALDHPCIRPCKQLALICASLLAFEGRHIQTCLISRPQPIKNAEGD